MSAHAMLSASASERWLNCPPSARLEAEFPESTSIYAEEGSLAHAIAELKLRKYYSESMSTRRFNSSMKKLQENELYNPEMQGYTDAYFDYINQITMAHESLPFVAVEEKLDLSEWVPEGFGTADCIIIGSDTLHVVDFKYGKGVPVTAENNTQIQLYALGAYHQYSIFYNIQAIRMAIVQPRLDNISEWQLSARQLLDFGAQIKDIAQIAFSGGGAFNAGEWCRFCRAKAQCRERSEKYTALEDFGLKKSPLLTDEEIGRILVEAQELKKWVSDLEDYALTATLAGKTIHGWKVVEGRRMRKFTDADAAFSELKAAGYDEALLYERRPITLTAAEKLVGKENFKTILASYVDIPRGKPTLVPETDKRKPYSTAQDDFSEPLPA